MLPEYHATEEPPPDYTPPSLYRVGGKVVTEPFTDVEQLKAHLALLRAFKTLRTAVEDDAERKLPQQIQDLQQPALRWSSVVALAAERFYRWVSALAEVNPSGKWAEQELPPIDVLMVWHAYMLNPLWYAEDCERLPHLRALKKLDDILLKSLVQIGDINTFQASDARRERWQSSTNTAWDIFDAASTMMTQKVECPKCYKYNSVPVIDASGRGYFQQKFEYPCTSCGFTIKKDSLALLKFVRDLTLDHKSPEDVAAYGSGVYMAGSLWNQYKPKDETHATLIKLRLRVDETLRPLPQVIHADCALQESREVWMKYIMQKLDYSMAMLAPRITRLPGYCVIRMKRVLVAYFDDKPYSIDLVGAVIRQGSFIDKMSDFGWTMPGYFDDKEDEVVLVHSIARYHAFMDLMSSSPGAFFVPTLDIDLSWHTHQLAYNKYHISCNKYIGRYIDHDDKVEESRLATSFDVTCRAWEKRYQLPYTYCGCPLPGDTVGQKLSRLKRRVVSNTDAQGLTPPRRPDALSATHASEHNSVYLPAQHGGFSEAERRKREGKLQRRKVRDEKLARDGKLRQDNLRDDAHYAAFLYPIPLYAYGPPLAGCVSVGGAGVGWTGVGGAACAVVSRR
ncbi:hypothetical protein BDW22DRAFT_1335746 [Trametopsis cervina]|nr:hypothetical protein BDW22DRAFT_1335746 [Trametopsis cervina]